MYSRPRETTFRAKIDASESISNLVSESVPLDDGLGLLDDAGHVNAVDVLGPGLGSEHREDAWRKKDLFKLYPSLKHEMLQTPERKK